MFLSTQNFMFCLWFVTTSFCSYQCQCYDPFKFKMCTSYVKPIYVLIKIKDMSKLCPLGTKNKAKNVGRTETAHLYFERLKSKFVILFKRKLI